MGEQDHGGAVDGADRDAVAGPKRCADRDADCDAQCVAIGIRRLAVGNNVCDDGAIVGSRGFWRLNTTLAETPTVQHKLISDVPGAHVFINPRDIFNIKTRK